MWKLVDKQDQVSPLNNLFPKLKMLRFEMGDFQDSQDKDEGNLWER